MVKLYLKQLILTIFMFIGYILDIVHIINNNIYVIIIKLYNIKAIKQFL